MLPVPDTNRLLFVQHATFAGGVEEEDLSGGSGCCGGALIFTALLVVFPSLWYVRMEARRWKWCVNLWMKSRVRVLYFGWGCKLICCGRWYADKQQPTYNSARACVVCRSLGSAHQVHHQSSRGSSREYKQNYRPMCCSHFPRLLVGGWLSFTYSGAFCYS